MLVIFEILQHQVIQQGSPTHSGGRTLQGLGLLDANAGTWGGSQL